MNPQTVLQERYPASDFALYFRYLSACKTVKGLYTQDHHICPRKQFPEYAEGFPENLITLSAEDHKQAHRLLVRAHPDFKRRAPDAWITAAVEGGRKGGLKGGHKGGSIGGKRNTPAQQATRLINIARARTTEHQVAAGRAGGRKNAQSGQLAILRTTEHQKKASAAAHHVYWHVRRSVINPKCLLCSPLIS
jgi:RNA polymerase subunit RPABC4/transcription elongation factor Spt4